MDYFKEILLEVRGLTLSSVVGKSSLISLLQFWCICVFLLTKTVALFS